MVDIKAEMTRLICMIGSGASTLRMICHVNKDEAAERIAVDIEENGLKLFKMLNPYEAKKMQEIFEKERKNEN